MAGNIWGLIESYTNTANVASNTRNIAAAILAAFEQGYNAGAGPLDRVAHYAGAGSSGNGRGFVGSGNDVGHNGFFVYRIKPSGSRVYSIYVLVQWGTSTNSFGSGSSAPGLWLNSAKQGGVGIQYAVALTSGGADANPWAGGTAFAGADAKAATVWAPPGGGTLYVFPRSNATGGSHVTNKQNCASLVDVENGASANPLRVQVVGDDDNILIAVDAMDNNSYAVTLIGEMTLAEGVATPVKHAMVQFAENNSVGYVDLGSTVGNNGAEGALVGWNGTTYQTLMLRMVFDANYLSATYQPNAQRVTPGFDRITAIAMIANEAPYKGLVGNLAGFVGVVQNVAVHDRTSDYKLAVVGGGTALTDIKLALPWDGGSTIPKSGVTTAGVTFRRSP